MSLQEPNFPTEMGNIPYDEIIGAPLNAAVDANTRASETAADFILNVAFEESDDFSIFDDNAREPVTVTFNYHKNAVDADGNATKEEFEMSVPLLLLLHVPYFEIENVTIDFNVKLHSVRKRQIETDGGIGGGGGLFGALGFFNVSGSYQKTDKRGQEIERTYDQSVHVEAGSIEPPTGVTRILDVLEQTITEEGGSDRTDDGDDNGE